MSKPANGDRSNLPKSYRKELLKKKSELLVSLQVSFKRLADAERTSEEDQVTVLHDESLQLGLTQVFYGELRQVESALVRLSLGEYGACADCGASISARRLQAVPWARYCVNCQDRTAVEESQELASLVIKIKPVEVLPAGQWVGGEVRNGPEKMPARNIELPIGRTRPSKTPK